MRVIPQAYLSFPPAGSKTSYPTITRIGHKTNRLPSSCSKTAVCLDGESAIRVYVGIRWNPARNSDRCLYVLLSPFFIWGLLESLVYALSCLYNWKIPYIYRYKFTEEKGAAAGGGEREGTSARNRCVSQSFSEVEALYSQCSWEGWISVSSFFCNFFASARTCHPPESHSATSQYSEIRRSFSPDSFISHSPKFISQNAPL